MTWSEKELIYKVELIAGIVLFCLTVNLSILLAIIEYLNNTYAFWVPLICGMLFIMLPVALISDGINEGVSNYMEVY